MKNTNLFPKRSAAFAIDLAVVYVTARIAGFNHGELLVAWLAYESFAVYWKGFTIGKYCLGLRVKIGPKKPISFSKSMIRALGKMVSTAVFFLGDLWPLWDRKDQTWHDKAAATQVVPNAE